MFTQIVDLDDSIQGFAHRWIVELAKHVDSLYVITGCLGKHSLPENVRVYSLGKESGAGRYKRILNVYKIALPLLIKRRVNSIFAHQIQHFAVSMGLIAKILRVPVFLFYAHKAVPVSLKMAVPFCTKIFTSTSAGFRINTSKKIIVGQGIDTEEFKQTPHETSKKKILLSVGRISPIKDQETLIKAASILKERGHDNFEILLVGDTRTAIDNKYKLHLISLIDELKMGDNIKFIGGVPNRLLMKYYSMSYVSINLTPTGAIDKVVLESMSCGRIPLVANQSLKKEFGPFSDLLIFKEYDPADLADKISRLLAMNVEELNRIGYDLRNRVIKNHNLSALMLKITGHIEEVVGKQ